MADYARHFNLLLVDLAGHGGSANESFGRGFNFSRAAEKVIAKCFIPQGKYQRSKRLFLNNAKKVSFDSFLNWLILGDGVGKYIKNLFNEYISIPTLYLMGEDDKLFLPQVQQTVRNGGDNVSLIVVPNAGHVCNVDNKNFFNQHSLEFMRSI